MLEIYNEGIYDLLMANPKASGGLDVKHATGEGIQIMGYVEHTRQLEAVTLLFVLRILLCR